MSLEPVSRFMRNEEAASAVEYGLIVGMIAVALIAVLLLLGGGIEGTFQKVCSSLPDSAC